MIHPKVIELRNISREYITGENSVVALHDISLTIGSGEMVAIVGQSGSGKSTLMNILGCLDRPSSGRYLIGGRITNDMDVNERAQLRRDHFGFIFQKYHLLNDVSALANVEVPAIYAGIPSKIRKEHAKDILSRLNMSDRLSHKPNELSGGQQQRVSIARALMNGGEIILADEPTGALDSQAGLEVMQILKELNSSGHTIIIVTHEMKLAELCDRVVELKDGKVIADRSGSHPYVLNESKFAYLEKNSSSGVSAWLDSMSEAAFMAFLAMRANKLRTFLTMLGIIFGIWSVTLVVALGQGAKKQILDTTDPHKTVIISPGHGAGDLKAMSKKH